MKFLIRFTLFLSLCVFPQLVIMAGISPEEAKYETSKVMMGDEIPLTCQEVDRICNGDITLAQARRLQELMRPVADSKYNMMLFNMHMEKTYSQPRNDEILRCLSNAAKLIQS